MSVFTLEHFAGWLPAWLAPVQVLVLPVGEMHTVCTEEIYSVLKKKGCVWSICEEMCLLEKELKKGK